MSSENLAASAEPEGDVFGPEDLVVLRESLDQAREALPPESRTAENMDALAVAIMRVAKCGERDPVRLLVHALKAIGSEANHGAV
jgi:hypothetical protein